MNEKGLQLFFVTKSGLGYQEGVYTVEEIKSLPNTARPHIISIGVAESLGYVVLDHRSGKNINELNIYAGIDLETGKQRKLKGVSEGTIDHPKIFNTDSVTDKIGNSLRDKLQEMSRNSAEDSLKAKIEAKKKELNNTKE
jgi:hypothetical protein